MNLFIVVSFASHIALALVLFLGVNWIGKHATDFGYASTTLFEDVNESVALNFFLRAMSPAVFIIGVSAIAVATGHPNWRIGIQWVAIYYYCLRLGVIFLLNRQRLIIWPKFWLHAITGVVFAMTAYNYLILPNRSLLPDVEQMGNELWLAIIAFLYAVANKVPVTSGPGASRRNGFVIAHYRQANSKFGRIIEEKVSDEKLQLIIYGVLIYEDYARPSAIRWIERCMFWKQKRTTGIMQVAGTKPLSDVQSVEQGTERLLRSWTVHAAEQDLYQRALRTIADYNADDDYVSRVLEVMGIIARRAEPRLRPAYKEIHPWG